MSKPSSSSIQAVVFDFDGVLFDTHSVHYENYNRIADYFGVAQLTNFEAYRDAFVRANGDWRSVFLEMGIPSESHDHAARLYEKHAREHKHRVLPYKGIKEVLEELHQKKIKTGIVSNNFISYISDVFNHHDFVFDAMVGKEYGVDKPNPASLLACLKELNVQSAQALYVGDCRIDIETARAAKVKMLAAAYGLEPEAILKTSNPETIIYHPQDILKYI